VCLNNYLGMCCRNDVESNIVTPNYGGLKCFVSIEKASLEYIYAPLAILIITNILFFLSTIRTLYKLRQSTKVATTSIRRQSISTSDKKRFLLIISLWNLLKEMLRNHKWTCVYVIL